MAWFVPCFHSVWFCSLVCSYCYFTPSLSIPINFLYFSSLVHFISFHSIARFFLFSFFIHSLHSFALHSHVSLDGTINQQPQSNSILQYEPYYYYNIWSRSVYFPCFRENMLLLSFCILNDGVYLMCLCVCVDGSSTLMVLTLFFLFPSLAN